METETEHELICRYMDGGCVDEADFLLIHRSDLRRAKLSERPEGYPVLPDGGLLPVCKRHIWEFAEDSQALHDTYVIADLAE